MFRRGFLLRPKPNDNVRPTQARAAPALPLDILYQIFLLVVQVSPQPVHMWSESLMSGGPMSVPLKLTHVCRSWRETAMTFPSLWTNFNVCIDGHRKIERNDQATKSVDLCIERSVGHPLNISVTYLEGRNHDASLSRLEYVLAKLLGNQMRWRAAHFSFICKDISALPRIELVDVPVLESFSVKWSPCSLLPRPDLRLVHIDTSCSTGLRSLRIVGTPHIEVTNGQLSKLIELTFHSLAIESTQTRQLAQLEILQKVPHLETLEIYFTSPDVLVMDNPHTLSCPVITLPNLHTLSVDYTEASMRILNNLALPALRHLICNCRSLRGNFGGVLAMLERSQPALECVEISDGDLTEAEIATLLRRFPDLKNLHMDIMGRIVNPHLFDILSVEDTTSGSDHPRRTSPILCPKLTKFVAKIRPVYGDTAAKAAYITPLCNMLEKRCIALGLEGSIECYFDNSRDTPLAAFRVPFVDIHCAQMRGTFMESHELEVRFKKRSNIES